MTENVVKIIWPSHHQHLAPSEDMFVLVRQIQKQHGVFLFSTNKANRDHGRDPCQ